VRGFSYCGFSALGLPNFRDFGSILPASNIVLDLSFHLINPREVCGYLTGKRTVCLLDLEKMQAEIKF